ncbi:PPE family protein [Mycobacterium lacus]|nr:PPE family protein [Mycobacterium lacus]MCV7123621.1 PPE family protein [Mycobacterium lacus]ORW01158.1 hypothetical protein AWC15_07735 [Mycobacterium lacus]
MLWHAMPPELNTARLMAGAGPAPMLEAAAGWAALAVAFDTQAVELSVQLRSLGEAWTGRSSERAIAAAMPMVTWLQNAAVQAKLRGQRATAQAAAYMQALETTPSLPEIAANHITRAVLTATNFFGINTVPIAVKEMDYFIRMWNQAASAMDVYQAETAIITRFEKIEAAAPIVVSGASQLAALAPKAAIPAGALPLQPTVTQLAGQAAISMQQLIAPLEQVTSLFGQTGSTAGASLADDGAQMGLLGVSPLSNHPLAGGSGPSMGNGLIRAHSLPGAGGSLAQTPLMASLIDKPATPAVVPAAASAEPAAVGGGAPMAVIGHGAQSGASARPGLTVPARPAEEPEEAEHETCDHQEDW